MKNLEEMEQYYFERDIFVSEIRTAIPNIWDIFDTYHNNDILSTDDFRMFRVEDEYYILHLESGTMINWYKNLGRTNTCNKNITIDEFREFLKMFRDDIGYEFEGKVDNRFDIY